MEDRRSSLEFLEEALADLRFAQRQLNAESSGYGRQEILTMWAGEAADALEKARPPYSYGSPDVRHIADESSLRQAIEIVQGYVWELRPPKIIPRIPLNNTIPRSICQSYERVDYYANRMMIPYMTQSQLQAEWRQAAGVVEEEENPTNP